MVAVVTGKSGSKSGELAEALAGGKKIGVCTIQTFPFALEKVRELAATQRKRFAVIADEAHSSQTGESAAKLKAVLSAEELEALADGGEVSTEDILAAQMATRAKDTGITYVALTATPKAKTLEIFGRRPDPSLPAGPANLPQSFHVYSMRQAIEEGFILDVLKNYTPYGLAFRLANGGREWDEQEVEREEALKGIMRWVRLHPYNIAQKVQIVIEHFRENVARLLSGQAKAMVVVGSRVEAVADRLLKRYKAERAALQAARAKNDAKAKRAAKDGMNALILFKRNLGAFLRVYAFLSQIFDYGNTDIEKRAIFFRRLLPLLEFRREREGVDLSKVQLTHHALRNQGRRDLGLGVKDGEGDWRLKPMSEPGSGELHEREKARLAEIIAAVNDLFEGQLSDNDKLVYINEVLKSKLLESQILIQQATNNTKEQFASSPDLDQEVLNAIMDALTAHGTMSKQALDSNRVRQGLKGILLGPVELWEALRSRDATVNVAD